MSIRVNGVEITDATIESELPRHSQAADPQDAARQTLVLRELMLQDAKQSGVQKATEEETLVALMEQRVQKPTPPDDAACQAFFAEHKDNFVRDELVEASHILFRNEEGTDPQVTRTQAELVLAQIQMNPERFTELARAHSACPSGAEGGSLGQIAPGQTVPEFEKALFALAENQLCDQLIETQFGLHIIKSGTRSVPGPVTFEEAKPHIERFLNELHMNHAVHDYLKGLADKAVIEGYTLPF